MDERVLQSLGLPGGGTIKIMASENVDEALAARVLETAMLPTLKVLADMAAERRREEQNRPRRLAVATP